MNTQNQELEQSVHTTNEEVQEAKKVLGELASEIPEEDLKNTVTEIHFLAESWLDEFERKTFGGKTLQELLDEGAKP